MGFHLPFRNESALVFQSAIASSRIDWRSNSLVEHDLFGKPAFIPDQVRAKLFPDHALKLGALAAGEFSAWGK
jgi:hypothetical protein